MAGWNLKSGILTEYCTSEERIWSLLNYVFVGNAGKRNTYKFGLIKSILDNLFNATHCGDCFLLTYEDLFEKFTENYWNLVVKYNLKQMRRDGKSSVSRIEQILLEAANEFPVLVNLEYESINPGLKEKVNQEVLKECKRYVVGALYEDFEGIMYSFDLKGEGIFLPVFVYEFLLKFKSEIEQLNYYSWAKFLEMVNDDNVLVKVIDKLELSTPKRNDLSIYRSILQREFEESNCFYCGKKLIKSIHVDHFIPWTFVKDDKIWNFVLACSQCNEKKSNMLPSKDYIVKINSRNRVLKTDEEVLIQKEFSCYSEDTISRMWEYAKMGGFKELSSVNR